MSLTQIRYPESLPISSKRGQIIDSIKERQVTIISGETGSGKTTQIPKMCLEAGLGKQGLIGCTQPRRIAALSVSRRIAEELGVSWGNEVGCKIRFSDKTSKDTRVKVMTDGILLAEIRSDPLLKAYDCIIIDEAHERSLTIDFLLGYLKQLCQKRPDLKIVITSATIDTELFSKAFDNAPIIEVSGRLYPVEINYIALNDSDQAESLSYVDGAIDTTRKIISDSERGDILIFMPTERDINECRERLSGALGRSANVLPLMGSLPAADQERIFKSANSRKIIVSTNIAETSLTIPGIRYVIDAGLARISRYSGKSRAKRLPIEPIAQSSANQRAGRAGRVEDGVCYRLYSRDDLEQRPAFTDPEILRANLAEVILRMKAFNLGDIEDFPFLNPPEPRAIRSGYSLLFELGALDRDRVLTSLGREMAKLPVDPTIARILIQARRERCLTEAVVIGAALSIQDPRERPADKRDKADLAHATFAHQDSDFITLINIWHSYSQLGSGKGSGAAQRTFCKANFLSWIRMREWSDLIAELSHATGAERKELPSATSLKRSDPRYRAIHRAIVSGFIGQVAIQTERDQYRGFGDRVLTIFPTSSLAEKRQSNKDPRVLSERSSATKRDKKRWIVAAEIVETTRAFIRCAARIEPSWLEDIAKHLLKTSYTNPAWDTQRAAVTARERLTLGGLTLTDRTIAYSKVAPGEALEIFIRSTLVVDPSPFDYPWISQNRRLADKIATLQALTGKLNRHALEERLIDFYRAVLPGVASAESLALLVKKQSGHKPDSFLISERDLVDSDSSLEVGSSLPDSIDVAGSSIELHYRYEPGGDRDGVTLEVSPDLAKRIPAHILDAAIPGLRQQQLSYLLRLLPKDYRRQIPALDTVCGAILNDRDLAKLPLIEALERGLKTLYSVEIKTALPTLNDLPTHLRPRLEIRSNDKLLCSGRDLPVLLNELSSDDRSTSAEQALPQALSWPEARSCWEKIDLCDWELGDLPAEIEVGRVGGVPIYLSPALCREEDPNNPGEARVSLRLVDSEARAKELSEIGVRALAQRVLRREIADLNKQSRALESWPRELLFFRKASELRDDLVLAALNHLFDSRVSYPLKRADFQNYLDAARSRLPNLVPSLLASAKTILESRLKLLATKPHYPNMSRDLEQLIPLNFISSIPYERLAHIPRYLKGMTLRCERSDKDPHRYQERLKELAPFENLLNSKTAHLPADFRWMVEEFKVSLFAQELGTPYPISAKRLERVLQPSP
jgi:ATP-dependent helicase HrpA